MIKKGDIFTNKDYYPMPVIEILDIDYTKNRELTEKLHQANGQIIQGSIKNFKRWIEEFDGQNLKYTQTKLYKLLNK